MAKPGGMDIDADLSGAGHVLGTIDGISGAIRTKVYIDSVLKDAHRTMANDFNTYMHAVAASAPEMYHHVYEWNATGVPGMQLWTNALKGAGRNKTATFEFRPSKTPVPKPDLPASSRGLQLSDKKYFFPAKAWVMEYSLPVRISGTPLLLDLRGKISERSGKSEEFIFAQDVFIENPGGDVFGNFTTAYLLWWGNVAPSVFETKVRPRYEQSVDRITTAAGRAAKRGRVGKRVRSQSFHLAFTAGREQARREAILEAAKYANTEYADAFDERFNA